MMVELKIKDWFFNKNLVTAAEPYHISIEVVRTEDNSVFIEDGYVTVFVDGIEKETEKAVSVRLKANTPKGWHTWLPKSVIA